MRWLLQNQAAVIAAIAGLSTILATVRNVLVLFGVLSTSKATWLGNLADRLSWLAEHGKGGLGGTVLSMPGLDSKAKGIDAKALVLVPLAFLLLASGCATSATPKGATLAQKIHDDETAISQFENDVKTQCGPQFAPLAATAGAILAIAKGVAAAASYDIAGALQAAGTAFPVLAADAKGFKCVYSVLKVDYAKFRPHARLDERTGRMQIAAIFDEIPICDNRADIDTRACRPIENHELPVIQ